MLLLLDDRKVESERDNDDEENRKDEANNEQWLLQHHDLVEVVLHIEVVDVILDQVALTECDDRSTGDVQVRIVKRVRRSFNCIRCNQLDILASFWQDDLRHQLIHHHIVKDMINHAHLQQILIATVEQVLKARHIIAQSVVSLPSTEQRESWTQIKLNRVLEGPHSRCGDVAICVTIIDTCRRCRKDCLVVFDTCRSTACVLLEVVTWEWSFQESAGVCDANCLFDSDVAPMWDLDGSFQSSDCHERWVVLVVDDNFSVGVG